MSDIRNLLQQNSGVLDLARQDSRRLRSNHPKVNAPESIFESPFDDLASLNTTLTPTTFAFDDDVINSKAYRMALAQPNSHRKDMSSTNLSPSSAESDQRNIVLRSLLREREDESIRLREQIDTLSKSNASLLARLEESQELYSAKSAEIARKVAESEKMKTELELASKREAGQNRSLQRMEKALSKKGKSSIFSLSREAPKIEPLRRSPKVWALAGVNDANHAVEICTQQRIIKEEYNDMDEMLIIHVDEESLTETKKDMERELSAMFATRKAATSYFQSLQQDAVVLVIGEKSLKHLQDEYVNLLLVWIMLYATVTVFW